MYFEISENIPNLTIFSKNVKMKSKKKIDLI